MTVRSIGNVVSTFRDRFNRTGNRASGQIVFSATGGNVSALAPGNGYTYHTFTSPGTLSVSGGSKTITYLVVAGGGGASGYGPGSGYGGGGGGAGGLRTGTSSLGPGSYSVTIGPGGSGGTGLAGGAPGTPSSRSEEHTS